MAIITNIKGNGNIEVTGDETSVTLNAQPIKGYDFKHFIISGQEITQNPYVLPKPSTDLDVEVVFYESINSYLQGCAPFDISNFIPGVLRGRGISYKEDLDSMNEEIIELCEADLYMRMTKIPSSRQHERDSDGGWSHDGGSITISDAYRTMLRAEALAIYKKHEDDRADEIVSAEESKASLVTFETKKQPVEVIINFL